MGQIVWTMGFCGCFIFNCFSAFLITGKRNFTDCCIWKLMDGFSFLCLNLFWFFLFPIVSYSHMHHDDIIGNLWECSNRDYCFGIGGVIGSLHVFLFFLVHYTIFLKNGLLFLAKYSADMKIIMGNVSMVYAPSLEKDGKTSCVSLFSLAFGIHGVTCLRLLAEYHTLNSWEWYWLATFNCEEHQRAWVPKSWSLKSQMIRFGEDLKFSSVLNCLKYRLMF